MKKRDYLKSQARKKSFAMRCEKLSANEIAASIRKGNDGFLQSIAWKKLRIKVIQAYGLACMRCGKEGKRPSDVNVDHIKPRALYPDLALAFDNLQVLCPRCNKSKGNKYVTDYRCHPA